MYCLKECKNKAAGEEGNEFDSDEKVEIKRNEDIGDESDKDFSQKEKENKNVKDWSDDNVSLLLDMFEESPCLWDVFNTDYSMRDLKEFAYSNIATSLDTTIAAVKAKINSLRTMA